MNKYFYQLNISGKSNMIKFKQKVGFSIDYKLKKLNDCIRDTQNTNVDIFPNCSDYILQIRKKYRLYQKDLAKIMGCERSYVSMLESGLRNPSRELFARFAKWLSKKDASCIYLLNLLKFNFRKIVSIKKIKNDKKYVYDLTVKHNENFVAGNGGVFVHNTFTMANVIAKTNKPTLIIAHNKTLAAQLYEEFKEYFPENRVEYFVSYYDYYQPESYLPATDQYIEKDSAINAKIEQMRHATTASLRSRSDVIVIASVSCIYGIGNPETYTAMGLDLNVKDKISRKKMIQKLVEIQYERNDIDLAPGRFRVKGETVDIVPGYTDNIIRFEFFGDEIERISELDKNTLDKIEDLNYFFVYPARHYVIPEAEYDRAISDILLQLREDLGQINDPLIKHRLKQRTTYDVEMIRETGSCKGIENYSRHFDNRAVGVKAFCLLDYFPDDFLLMVDESHRTVPQVGGMYNGDRARKKNLIEYGFRLSSAFDNRPLKFDEFEEYMKANNVIFVSATPAHYEYEHSKDFVEQIIRPTGLVDPEVEIRPVSPKEGSNGKEQVVLLHGYGALCGFDKMSLPWLKKELEGKGYFVTAPDLPNKSAPKFDEWVEVLEKEISFDENTILSAESFSGLVVLRILERLKKPIKKLVLSGCFCEPLSENRPYHHDLDWKFDFEKIKKNVGEVIVLSDKNDDRVPYEKTKSLADKLGVGVTIVSATEPHFRGTKEPTKLEAILEGTKGNKGQVKDVLEEIKKTIDKGDRVLITTLTKRMAEELTDFLAEKKIKTRYLHSEIDTFERTEIIRELRLGTFDCLVGINLLREGIDIPEVGFVGILDADKEGFLRDASSLIQIIGRAARNSRARVVLYADKITKSIKNAMEETARRREIQLKYNKENNIIPQTIIKPIKEKVVEVRDTKHIPKADIPNLIIELEADMKEAAEMLDFEKAIAIREKVTRLKKRIEK